MLYMGYIRIVGVFCSATDLDRIWKHFLKLKTTFFFFLRKCYKFMHILSKLLAENLNQL